MCVLIVFKNFIIFIPFEYIDFTMIFLVNFKRQCVHELSNTKNLMKYNDIKSKKHLM